MIGDRGVLLLYNTIANGPPSPQHSSNDAFANSTLYAHNDEHPMSSRALILLEALRDLNYRQGFEL